MSTMGWTCVCTLAVLLWSAPKLEAATIFVPAGGDLQQALNDAQPGDTILLEEDAEFVGNFVLPMKAGDAWITLRSAAPDTVLPAFGVRIRPSHAPLLARVRSPNAFPALRTKPGAHHWDIRYLEFPANQGGFGDIVRLGDGSSAQNSLDKVPHHIVLNHVYVHGDPHIGQKRGIALNAAAVTISDSHVSDCKGVGQDTQAIGGWNGPGPYVIENNYLEAAGENVLIGGSDPAIANLVADGISVRGNHFSRPMSWRDPLVPTPQGIRAVSTAGGSLPAGTYGYRVIARRLLGSGTMTRSTASAEVRVTTADPGAVRVRWQAVAGATEYRVYGRTPGAGSTYWRVTTTEFIDTGASGTSEAVPTSVGTVWSVKNIFELKNARNVVISENIFENHWRESQPGYAIVFTPRNSGGSCTWCVVENVRFEHNLVRNVAAGINVLGYDAASSPTRQTSNITVHNNLFTGLHTSLGGNGWFMMIGDEPRTVTVSHNTVDSNGNALVYTYGGNSANPRLILGLEVIANASRHGSYGFNGQNFPYGNGILNGYYPGAVFSSNYLAGAPLSKYPVGTKAARMFRDQFVNVAAGNYTVRAASILKGTAPGGADIGADFTTLSARVSGVIEGLMGDMNTSLMNEGIAPGADFTMSCTLFECSFTDVSIAGSLPIATWSWTFGDGTSATGADSSHAFAAAGTYSVTLSVADVNGLAGSVTKTVTVEAAVPPTANMHVACEYLQCSFSDATIAGSGDIVSRTWTFGDGTPAVIDATSGVHVFLAAGTYSIRLQVTDANGLAASSSVEVTVAPSHVAPEAAFTPSCVDLTCTFTDNSVDADGTVSAWSWSFGTSSSTLQSPSFSFAAPGTYPVTLTVTDDDGAQSAIAVPVQVTGVLHASYSGFTTRWSSASGYTNYWSADVTVTIHGADERIIPGARVTAAWSGAVVKTVRCVTKSNGTCVLKSGTLSYLRSTATLSVTSVVARRSVFNSGASHDPTRLTSPFTLVRP
jgi:PKD repeat protein